MDVFHSSELFGAFLACETLFLISVLVDRVVNQRGSNDVEILIDVRQRTWRFKFKRIVARLLLKLSKQEEIPDNIVDQLKCFSDQDEMPVDAVYFNTSSDNGQVVLFATSRRKRGLVETLGMLKIPDFSDKFLVLPVFPRTSLYQSDEEQRILDCYTVAGLKIKSIVPKKEYHIDYTGKMVIDTPLRKEVNVRLNAVWRSSLPTFNFSTDVSQVALSEAMALEPWSKQYFNTLKSHHQTHYEQYGDLRGVIDIDGNEYTLNTGGIRDHTVGAKRDWKDFHRYVLHFMRLSNGNSISLHVISVPVMFTRFVAGFITIAEKNVNIPIDSCSIDLNVFDKLNPPDEYAFDFIALLIFHAR